jgi:hypothetical protein
MPLPVPNSTTSFWRARPRAASPSIKIAGELSLIPAPMLYSLLVTDYVSRFARQSLNEEYHPRNPQPRDAKGHLERSKICPGANSRSGLSLRWRRPGPAGARAPTRATQPKSTAPRTVNIQLLIGAAPFEVCGEPVQGLGTSDCKRALG